MLSNAKGWLLDVVFPKFCLACGKEGYWLCQECRETKLLFRAPACPICSKRNFSGVVCEACAERCALRRFLAPFSYHDGLVRELIHTYKYEGVRELKRTFAEEVLKFLEFYGVKVPPSAVLVPIPLHRSRERERGFNQAKLIADELGTRWGVGVASLLKRKRATEQQIEMASYSKRRENVAGAFEVKDPAACSGQTVILVDDVSTSGATLYEAARALREAGARTVWAIAIAKG